MCVMSYIIYLYRPAQCTVRKRNLLFLKRSVESFQVPSNGRFIWNIVLFDLRIGVGTVHYVITETLSVIWKFLGPMYFCWPTTQEWKKKAKEYNEIWQLPHCVGSLDGKHIRIQKPANGASQYIKILKYCVVGCLRREKYNFSYVCIGAYGSESDRIFAKCLLGRQFKFKYILFKYFFQIKKLYNFFRNHKYTSSRTAS